MNARLSRRRKAPPTLEERDQLKQKIVRGELSLGQAVKAMRQLTGLTQDDYARRIVGIYPRVLKDIENDRGNPTLETLKKIGRPFGLNVGFVPEQSPTVIAEEADNSDL